MHKTWRLAALRGGRRRNQAAGGTRINPQRIDQSAPKNSQGMAQGGLCQAASEKSARPWDFLRTGDRPVTIILCLGFRLTGGSTAPTSVPVQDIFIGILI